MQQTQQLNLVHELLDRAEEKGFAERPLLRSPTCTLSYAQTRQQVDRIAQVLHALNGLLRHSGQLSCSHPVCLRSSAQGGEGGP